MYYVYILENPNGGLYIGQTGNLEVRISFHNSGKSIYTKNKGPWKLLYKKEFSSRYDALRYEKYLKSLKSSKYIRNNIIAR